MKAPYLLHIFSPEKNVSPFDVNMAYEAEYDGVIPYAGVTLDEITTLTQDTIFSRGVSGVKKTGIFIGGREFGLAIDMLERAKIAMVKPFEISVFADPSGAITTAAAMIACIEDCLKKKTGESLQGKKLNIMGGTGPVGLCAGVIADKYCGAEVFLMSHRGSAVADESAEQQNAKFGVTIRGGDSSTAASIKEMMQSSDILISSAKAGIQVISQAQMSAAGQLLIAADANAVPPLGIEGIDAHDMGRELEFMPHKTLGIGALAMGNVKYKVHSHMFKMMKQSDKPLYLNYEDAFKVAREYVTK